MNFNKEIILDCIKDFLENFSKEYTKAFIIAIIKNITEQKEENKAVRQLLHFVPEAPVLASEVKYSDGSSKFKSQYWKITSDFNIQVWSKEEDLKLHEEQVAANADKVKQPLKVICPWDYSRWYWTPPEKEFPKRRGGPLWISDKDRSACVKCDNKFTAMNRRHHCRTCGDIFCGDCSNKKWPLYKLGYPGPQKVCIDCFDILDSKGLDSMGDFEVKETEDVYGVQLTHSFRTPYFFLVASPECRREWLDALYVCCRNAAAPVNANPMMAHAFETAHRYVWNTQGPWWRWWKVFGSEEEMLTVLLAYIVERRCMSAVLSGLGVPSAFRRRAEAGVRKSVEGFISSGISSVWPATLETVGQLEQPMREKLTPVLEPIGAAKMQILASLKENVSGAVSAAMDSCVKPLLDKVLDMSIAPLLNSHVVGYGIFKALYTHVKNECRSYGTSTPEEFRRRVRAVSWKVYYSLQDKVVAAELRPLEDALKLLGNVPPFHYLNAYGIRSTIYDSLYQLLNDAFFTLEQDVTVLESLGEGKNRADLHAALDEAYNGLNEKLFHDSQVVVRESMVSMLHGIIGLPIKNTVYNAPGVEDALRAADNMIPQSLKEFMSVTDLFNELLDGVVDEVVDGVINSQGATHMAKLTQGWKGVNEP